MEDPEKFISNPVKWEPEQQTLWRPHALDSWKVLDPKVKLETTKTWSSCPPKMVLSISDLNRNTFKWNHMTETVHVQTFADQCGALTARPGAETGWSQQKKLQDAAGIYRAATTYLSLASVKQNQTKNCGDSPLIKARFWDIKLSLTPCHLGVK